MCCCGCERNLGAAQSHSSCANNISSFPLRRIITRVKIFFFFSSLFLHIAHATTHPHTHTDAHSTSASPTFFFLMAYCRQWLRVLVNNRFVDLRIISSTSVELWTHTHTQINKEQQRISDCAKVCFFFFSISQRELQCLEASINSLNEFLRLRISLFGKSLNASQFK